MFFRHHRRYDILLSLVIISIRGIPSSWASLTTNTFECPENEESSPIQIPPDTLIKVKKTTWNLIDEGRGNLCTLIRVTTDNSDGGKEYFAPVARSYDGFDWNRVAGPYSESLEITCMANGNSYCHIQVPKVNDNTDIVTTFRLMKYERTLPIKDEVARFFEQSTFGTRLEDINTAVTSIDETYNGDSMNYFSSWLHEQIYTVPPTFHRPLWRNNIKSKADGPRREGITTHPCDPGSRWRSRAFAKNDVGKRMTIGQVSNGKHSLSINGQIRTMVNGIDFVNPDISLDRLDLPASFEICIAAPHLGYRFGILYKGICEETIEGIPFIDVDGMVPKPLYVFDLDEDLPMFRKKMEKTNPSILVDLIMKKRVTNSVALMNQEMDNDLCSSIVQDGTPVYAKLRNHQTVIFVPRLVLQTNTLDDPLHDGGGNNVVFTKSSVQCSNAPRTFLNDETCQLSDDDNACTNVHTDGSGGYFQSKIELTRSNILEFHKLTGRYIYAVQDLRQYTPILDFPCQQNAKSRWMRIDKVPCPKYLKEETQESFQWLLEKTTDPNPFMKDIIFNGICHEQDVPRRKFHVKVDGECWMNVHPDQFNVYDFTNWAIRHPGGRQKIEQFAENGSEFLFFPDHHEMQRWYQAKDNGFLQLIGRYGDKISIQDLPDYLSGGYTESLSSLFHPFTGGQNTLVCGSPGESSAASDTQNSGMNPSVKISSFEIAQSDVYEPVSFEQVRRDFEHSKKDIWLSIALWSEDQVRQRMAWALSQLLAVSASPFDGTLSTEIFISFYDIFVRNAFGSYRDVLREVAYSPMMATMLTYHKSKSQEYIWRTSRRVQFADENFAREVMQLFSIGMFKLNMDGTFERDSSGNRTLTYTNDDIEEYARVWTGFARQQLRGNIEEQEGGLNSIDPMKVFISWRDRFPKMGMDKKYVGDGYMLCSDLPPKSYLREGATYRLLGNSKSSESQHLPVQNFADVAVTVLPNNSRLLEKLCDKKGDSCRYKSLVVLESTISCEGEECELHQIQVVQVAPDIYYEYVKPACVHPTFFRPGHLVAWVGGSTICVDPNSAVASAACCLPNSDIATHDTCSYPGERISFAEAEERCASSGRSLCPAIKSIDKSTCGDCCHYTGRFWMKGGWDGSGRCQEFAVIDNNGKVAIEAPDSKFDDYHALTYFRVNWKEDFPKVANGCGSKMCAQIEQYCRCRVMTQSIPVFTTLPTRRDVMRLLHVGGAPPALVDYTASAHHDGMRILFTSESRVYDSSVVFEVTDRFGRTLYLKNVQQIVQMATFDGNPSNEYVLRNPPTFFNSIPEVRDAEYETEAALDHYMFHQNTAPFLARRFIQRFGFSNPSPSMINLVSEAFTSGTITFRGKTFGSGNYGDLRAVIAAILLGNETRHDVLDKDPSYGSLREPLLKVVSTMRNMDYLQIFPENVGLYGAKELLGQMAYELPDVFSFFRPENMPSGPISRAALVAPEAMLLHKARGMVNGLLSFVEFGLTSCHEGLGARCPANDAKHGYASSGVFSYDSSPPHDSNEVIDELSTLLTSGRMSATNRRIVREAYSHTYATSNDRSYALQIAQQLILVSAEFHSTGLAKNSPRKREVASVVGKKTCNQYKAVVHLILKGGMDSYNLLVPHSQCQTESQVSYEQYKNVRGSVAVDHSSLLKINADGSSQPCKIFGVHPNMPFLKDLYDQKDASFIAGVGVLSEPVDKANYLSRTKSTLFSHEDMILEIDRLDPFNSMERTGILGRLADILSANGNHVNKFTVDRDSAPVEGMRESSKVILDTFKGFSKFNEGGNRTDFLLQNAELLNGNVEEGFNNVFSDAWSSTLYNVRDSGQYYWAQEFVNMDGKFPESTFGNEFRSVAQMIASHECRGSDTDLFALSIPMFDHHHNLNGYLPKHFDLLNEGLKSFVDEMGSLNMWDNVLIVVTSEFGRTLTPNSEGGTDHGWSGNSFILGGAVKGGKIHGHYPTDLSTGNPINIGRGRLIPQIPWEALWNSVSQWIGISENDLNHVLPNRLIFKSKSMLLEKGDLFLENVPSKLDSCEGEGTYVSCEP